MLRNTVIFSLLTAAFATSAMAQLNASANVTPSPLGGGQFNYSVALSNTGTTTVGTLWFAWIPGQNYLATSPTVVTSPAGWTSTITHGSATDGYAIRWTATSAASYLAAGADLTGFSFNSALTPASLAGPSVPYPAVATLTSFVYSGAPFSDNGRRFIATVVPSPASAGVLIAAAIVPLRRRRRAAV